MKIAQVVVVAIIYFSLAIPQANAEFIFNSFGPGDSFNPSASRSAENFPGRRNDVAQAFRVPSSSDFLLDSIELQLRGGTATTTVFITGDDPVGKDFGTNPGVLFAPSPDTIESFQVSARSLDGTFLGSKVTVSSSLNPTLDADRLYWIYLSILDPNEGSVAWLSAPASRQEPTLIAERFNKPLWEVSSLSNGAGFTFRVNGTPVVPEPSSIVMLGIGCIALCGYGRQRKRKAA